MSEQVDHGTIELLIMRLAAEYRGGRQVNLGTFVQQHGLQTDSTAFRDHILPALLAVDLRHRCREVSDDHDHLLVSDYVRMFPMITQAQQSQLTAEEQRLRGEKFAETLTLNPGDLPMAEVHRTDLVVPGFSDLRPIGSGALGVIYSARQLGTDRRVAIKLIRPELELDSKAQKLFIREASIISRLNHPRIVQCLGFGFAGIRPYLVMEYIASADLEALVWRHDPARRIRLAVKVVLQVLEALIYSHSKGIVHRDIKPSNVLACRSADRLRLKVADFGLAKLFETAGHSGITNTGELCGTLAYMAPEQLTDSRSAGPECDVYAVVVCLFRLLSGEYPYPESTLMESFQRRMSEDARLIRQFNPKVPETLERTIAEGLLRDPDQRLKSAEVLYRSLKPFASRPD